MKIRYLPLREYSRPGLVKVPTYPKEPRLPVSIQAPGQSPGQATGGTMHPGGGKFPAPFCWRAASNLPGLTEPR